MRTRTRGVAALAVAHRNGAGIVPAGSAAAATATCSRARTPSTRPTDSHTSTKSPKASAPSPSNSSTPPTHSPSSSTASTAKPSDNQPHPVVTGDVIHPPSASTDAPIPVCDTSPVVQTFTANTTVEIRLALGGERDWDFDWTPFTVGQPEVPTTKAGLQARWLGSLRVPQPGPVHQVREGCRHWNSCRRTTTVATTDRDETTVRIVTTSSRSATGVATADRWVLGG